MKQWMIWGVRSVVILTFIYFLFSYSLLPLYYADEDDYTPVITHASFNVAILGTSECTSGGSWGDFDSNTLPALMVHDCKKSSLYNAGKQLDSFSVSNNFAGTSTSSCWGDINADGYDDVIILGQGEDQLYMNKEGVLTRDYYFFNGTNFVDGKFCFLADINADGLLDIIRINKFNEFTILQSIKPAKGYYPVLFSVMNRTDIPHTVKSFVGIAQNVIIVVSPFGTLQLYDYARNYFQNITHNFFGFPQSLDHAVIFDIDNDFSFDVILMIPNSPPVISYNLQNFSFLSSTLPEYPDIPHGTYKTLNIAVFDADNDMLPDIFAVVQTSNTMNYYLYINKGTSFEVVKIGSTEEGGSGKYINSRPNNLAIADFNLDGYVDLALFDTNTLIFENRRPFSHNWIEIELIVIEADTSSGVQVGILTQNSSQIRIVSSSQNSHKRLHFGIGNEQRVTQIFVRWKMFTQRFYYYKANQLITLLSPFAYKNKHALQVVGQRPPVQLQCPGNETRLKPHFLILGIYKSGTTSLSATLASHPQITLGSCKEIHYFDEVYQHVSIDWYWSQFPCSSKDLVTFEATAGYLMYESVPPLVQRYLPHAKFIVLLRNPVDRMYSHYYMVTAARWEGPEKFDEVARKFIGKFTKCIEKTTEIKNFTCDPKSTLFPYENCTEHGPAQVCTAGGPKWTPFYAGLYYFAILRWFERFPRDQFKFIHYPDLLKHTDTVVYDIEDFLDLNKTNLTMVATNVSPNREKMLPETREWLSAIYKPYNALLYKLLNIDYGWDP